ncbi:hypothetical protein [Clostridium ganghwense]|uniref:Uncharacterized protein n=1 Tax=Clostridium ganghwense TaxID=312089 RepID=A0ABT4CMZ1_9CLOT|nr:hypothetical protein [Clostridium ganghwense]MCY6370420.1 hypothetical protein [Clostridium ganghwense]
MEYRLNKIDMEIRQIVNDSAKEGKVHGSKVTEKVDKDKKKNKEETFKKKLLKNKGKKRIMVDAVKLNNVKIEAIKEERVQKSISTGRFLDITK